MATENVNHGSEAGEDLDKVYQDVLCCQPIVLPSEMEALADLVFSKERVIRSWRLAALVGSKDGEFFQELANDADKAKALAPTVDALRDAAGVLRSMAEVMESVSCRIMVAGCNHEHFNEWMESEPA